MSTASNSGPTSRRRGDRSVRATNAPQTISVGSGYRQIRGTRAPRYQYIFDDNSRALAVQSGNWSSVVIDSGQWKATGPYFHDWGAGGKRGANGSVSWDLKIAATDTVSAWWLGGPSAAGLNAAVSYEVIHRGKDVASGVVDQRKDGDEWRALTTIQLRNRARVRMRCGGSGDCIAEAVYVESAARFNDAAAVLTVTLQPMDGIVLIKR